MIEAAGRSLNGVAAIDSPLGDIGSPSPHLRHWLIGGAVAVAAHALAAAPFLPKPLDEPVAAPVAAPEEAPAIGVNLAPVVQPPDPTPAEAPPEDAPEIPVLEERASDSPPPAPPATPRELPKLPDITPRAVPDLWYGSGEPGSGALTLDEFVLLKAWLDEARLAVLSGLSYPEEARRDGLSGAAMVVIVTDRNGRILTWSFRQRTGAAVLDREIERTINSIRRLPRFPKEATYDKLTFAVPIRFELVFQDRRGRELPPPDAGGPTTPQTSRPAAPPTETLSVAQITACAAAAADLTAKRDAIEARQIQLQEDLAQYERQAARYERERRDPPLRVRRMLERYNDGVAAFNAEVEDYQIKAGAFSAQCGRGSATWENYQQACAPYRASGNAYCEAFGDLWVRLRPEGSRAIVSLARLAYETRLMAKKEKTFRPKARLPKGFRDRLGEEIVAEREMLARIAAVYEAWGFDPLETPAFEYTDALGKFLPDVERPNAGVFSLQDDDDQWMSLRYDLTAPLARFVAENYDALPKPFRRYAVGQVWRNEKPGPGRYRQFTQIDADTVGAPAPNADAEAVAMLSAAIEAALAPSGLGAGGYLIQYNDRNVLTGLLEAIGVDEERDGEKKLGVLRAMDKLDRLGPDGVRLLLGEGRKDESGDYTEGAKLGDADIDRVMAFMAATKDTNAATCDALADLIGGSEAGMKGVETLAAMSAQLATLGLDETRAVIDLSVIRGLEYYTGPVFEGELAADLKDAKGGPSVWDRSRRADAMTGSSKGSRGWKFRRSGSPSASRACSRPWT